MKATCLLEVDQISKTFSNVSAVSDLSFRIEHGEIFALLGPNGAGKTTTVRMLMNIIHPDEGTIRYGIDLDHGQPLTNQLGYLPEDRGLFKDIPILKTMTYMGILRGMPRSEAMQESKAWLERLDLADRFKDRLDTLSKGNQQKVQFAAAILHKPIFAVLDEPFSGFDPLNQDLFVDIIAELRQQGTTVLLSAHQMPLVERLADRVLLMNKGKAVLHGTVGELQKNTAGRRKLVLDTHSPIPDDLFENHPALIRCEKPNPQQLVLHLREDVSLSELLAQAATVLDIRGIHTSKADLHDVYIQAFGAGKTEEVTP